MPLKSLLVRTGLAELLRELFSCNRVGIFCEKCLVKFCLSSFIRKCSSKGSKLCRKALFATNFASAKSEFHENFRSAGVLPGESSDLQTIERNDQQASNKKLALGPCPPAREGFSGLQSGTAKHRKYIGLRRV